MKYFVKDHELQTFAEEMANAATHGFGLILSIASMVAMIGAAHFAGIKALISCGVFGITLILLYSSSTLYHAIWHIKIKTILQMVDHMMIYLLIAGTYTPFTLIGLGGSWGWSLFCVIWGLALMGVVFKIFFTGRLEKLSVGIYIGMGWLVIVAIKPFMHALPFAALMWVAAGGLFYTVGIVFYVRDRIRFAHTIWHLFVLAGSLSHVVAVLYYILPRYTH